MGLDGVCKNPLHIFDREKPIERIYDEQRDDYIWFGWCPLCNSVRVVKETQLKSPVVIEMKNSLNLEAEYLKACEMLGPHSKLTPYEAEHVHRYLQELKTQ